MKPGFFEIQHIELSDYYRQVNISNAGKKYKYIFRKLNQTLLQKYVLIGVPI
jgi:hypothetical protein